jgi:hypothetical protein
VIQRLNDAFDADWSFTITHHEILKETDEVIVIGQLNAGWHRQKPVRFQPDYQSQGNR